MEKDAAAIADLVRVSFRPWLERGNIVYLDNLHQAGMDATTHPLWTKISSFPYQLPGVVCVDDSGQVLGLLNTYTFFQGSQKCSLIANVCVDPTHRREGIASHMLNDAGQSLRSDGFYGMYVQTRMEEPDTFKFYKHNGFNVTDFRETWILPTKKSKETAKQENLILEVVPRSDKENFRAMFADQYPASVLWNLDYSDGLFRTGKIFDWMNRITSRINRFRRVLRDDGTVVAWVSFQELNGPTDQLWLIWNGSLSVDEQGNVLSRLAAEYNGNKALKLDVPVGDSTEIYRDVGFIRQQTLAWMWKKL